MVKARRGTVLFVLSVTALTVDLAADFELNVRVVSKETPTEVTMQREDDIQPRAMTKAQASTFKITLPVAELREGASTGMRAPYRLVASWGDDKEQMYLGLRSTPPGKVSVDVFHDAVSADRPTLNAIDALGTDFTSIVQRYFRARAVHRKWRQQGLPNTQDAVRSARIWFDAAAALVKWPKSFFRMDQDVESVFKDYEALAERDNRFLERYRLYAPPGYIQGTLKQLMALEYKVVADIPRLIAAGNYEEAGELNAKVLEAYTSESPDTQRDITKRQGVDVKLLKANAVFIETKQASSTR